MNHSEVAPTDWKEVTRASAGAGLTHSPKLNEGTRPDVVIPAYLLETIETITKEHRRTI